MDSSNFAVAGMYEDRSAFMNMQQYYSIELDCMTRPDGELMIKEFFGTLEQIGELIGIIAADDWVSECYASTIRAWKQFQKGNLGVTHVVGSETKRLLTPVNELCRSKFLIDRPQWTYEDRYGCILRAAADMVDVEQVLLQDGNRLIRCARYWFEGLQNVESPKGWKLFAGNSRGIPYMVESDEEGIASLRLFVQEQLYAEEKTALQDMQQMDKLNYRQLSRELFSGC